MFSPQLGNLVTHQSTSEVNKYLTSINRTNPDLLFQELTHRYEEELTPLHLAVKRGDFSMVKVLLSFDASIDAKIRNQTVEDYAKDLVQKNPSLNEARKIYALIKTRGRWQLDAEQSKELSICRAMKAVEETVEKIEGAAGKKGVLCVGITGEGKSTFINFLYGVDYKKKRVKGLRTVEAIGAEIACVGNTTISQTLLPQVISYGGHSHVLVDLPGFEDTRGSAEEICAAAGVGLLTKQLGSIQSIVLVSSWNSLSDARIVSLRKAAQSVGAMMSKDPETHKNLILVVTKPDEDLEENDVRERLDQIASDEKWEDLPPSLKREDVSADVWKKYCLKIVIESLLARDNSIVLVDVTQPKARTSFQAKLTVLDHLSKTPDQFDFTNYSQYMTQFKLLMESMIVHYNNLSRNTHAQSEKLKELKVSIQELKNEEETIQTSIETYQQQMEQPFTEESFNQKIIEDKQRLQDLRKKVKKQSNDLQKAELATAIANGKLNSFAQEGEKLIDTVHRGWICEKTEERIETEVEEVGQICVPGRGIFTEVRVHKKVIPGKEKTVSEPLNYPSSVPIKRYVDRSQGGVFQANSFKPGLKQLTGTFISTPGIQGGVSLNIELYGDINDFPETKDQKNQLELEAKRAHEQLEVIKEKNIPEEEVEATSERIRTLELEKIAAVGNHERTKSICELKIQFEQVQLRKIQDKFSEMLKLETTEENELSDLKLQMEVNEDFFAKLREVVKTLGFKSEIIDCFMQFPSKPQEELKSISSSSSSSFFIPIQ